MSQFLYYRWDEIGRYDIPACINYVLRKTGSRKLTYIGHSMGIEYRVYEKFQTVYVFNQHFLERLNDRKL